MSEEIIGRRFQLSSFQIIILGFAGVILLGALLLMLPISTQEGCTTPFNEALFTATSAVCVTGLVIHDTGSYWSAFGKTVILALILRPAWWCAASKKFFVWTGVQMMPLLLQHQDRQSVSASE